ncbi:helix-turn-helix domain-containing protein [Phreatobacter stygius]|uniref:Helix-turn-helix domain-containing protein n=1 Tax=Phreatobacter stygius TaxID=1940610 RepID=A0A4D7BCP2_9HYPH|nr:AraC family transcriptional regulator [Phreatobacter stygius]QCI67146.1 helix-turn-helix domain-containing protein [Phreatobacter stygius]
MTTGKPTSYSPDRRAQQWSAAVPVRSYARDRADGPRFHIRESNHIQGFYPTHKHDYFQIIYFRTAAPTIRIGLTADKPAPGSIYFIGPMVPHQVRFDRSTRCVVVYFDLDFLRPDLTTSYPAAELARIAPELYPFVWQNHVELGLGNEARTRLERCLAVIRAAHDAPRLCSGAVIRAELSLLLAGICQDHEADFVHLASSLPAPGRDGDHMRRIADYIGENYAGPTSLARAAAATRLSRSRLCALIRGHTGKTFQTLVAEMRIEDACERLAVTDEPVGRIAHGVGYHDEKYFLRAFKKLTGLTPREFRSKKAGPDREADMARPGLAMSMSAVHLRSESSSS